MDEGFTIEPVAIETPEGPMAPDLPPTPDEISAPKPRGRSWLVVAIAAVVGLIAAGAVGAFFVLRGSGEVLLDDVPADVDIALAVYLDPAASQKVSLLRIAERFPDLADQERREQTIDAAVDDLLEGSGLTHDDLEWVGDEVAAWFDVESDGASGAVLVHSADDDAARAAIDAALDVTREPSTSEYLGVTVWTAEDEGAVALVDGVVVVGSDEEAVERTLDVMRNDRPALETSEAFVAAIEGLPEAKLALGYVNAAQITEGLEDLTPTEVVGSPLGFGQAQSVAFTLAAESDGFALEAMQVNDTQNMDPAVLGSLNAPPHANAALPLIPGDAYGAFAAEHMDTQLDAAFASLDDTMPDVATELENAGITGAGGLVAVMTGDLAFEASPDPAGPIGGSLLIGVDDGAEAELVLDRTLVYLFGSSSAVGRVETEHGGITITSLDAGPPVAWAFVDGVLVVGSSSDHVADVVDAASGVSAPLADQADFTGRFPQPDVDSLVYLDLPAILSALRENIPPEELAGFEEDVAPYMDPIGRITLTTDGDATSTRQRVFVEVP